MASLPGQYPSLALHLADRALLPIISSATDASPAQQTSLDMLMSTAWTAYGPAARLELGRPLRIMIECEPGLIVLSSWLAPEALRTRQQGPSHLDSVETPSTEHDISPLPSANAAPSLVGIVVAPKDKAPEAQQAVLRLETLGRRLQTALSEENGQAVKAD